MITAIDNMIIATIIIKMIEEGVILRIGRGSILRTRKEGNFNMEIPSTICYYYSEKRQFYSDNLQSNDQSNN